MTHLVVNMPIVRIQLLVQVQNIYSVIQVCLEPNIVFNGIGWKST